jgi:rubrerythrin
MSEFRTAVEILHLAMAREEAAAAAYEALASRAQSEGLRTLLLELRDEEIEHRKRLGELAAGGAFAVSVGRVEDLRITDDLAETPLDGEATFQDLLIFAAKKEAKAAAFYTELGGRSADPAIQSLFGFLAGQEKEHKRRLEQEYENLVFKEN